MNFNPRQYFFLALLAGAGILGIAMLLPYLQTLAVAAVMSVVFRPLYRWLLTSLKTIESAAAFLTVVIAVGLILVPLLVLGGLVYFEAHGFIEALRAGGYATSDTALLTLSNFLPGISTNVTSYFDEAARLFTGNLAGFLSSTLTASINFFLGLLAFFYFLKDGQRIATWFGKFSPLTKEGDYQLLDRLELAVNAVVTGTVVVAVVQGVMAGIGFAIFGLPNPALWGGVAVLAALIPGVGTALVMIPAVLYLGLAGTTGAAVGLLIWGVLVVGLIDNIFRPWIIGRSFRVHPFLVLLSVLGGLSVFGPLGLLLGPLVLALLVVLVDMADRFIPLERRN